MDTQVRGYPEKLRFLSAFGVTAWIPSHLGIHLVTPKALKNLNFSGYPLTWVSILLHQKRSKFSLFCDACMLCNFDTVTPDIMTPLLSPRVLIDLQ